MKQVSPFNQPKQTLYFILSVLLVIIIAGSIVGMNQAGFSISETLNNLGQSFVRIGGANLVVTVEDKVMPADNKSQTTIHTETIGSKTSTTASILQGSGTIQASATDKSNGADFIYTAGPQLGKVEILIKSGGLEHTINIQLVEVVTPDSPHITSPSDGTTVSESYPTVTGTGMPNTKIIITNNGNQNTITTTDASGNFSIQLSKPLYNGQHTLVATAINELKITSPLSNLITISVKTLPAKLDTQNIRISPNPVLANKIFGVFVPASLNAKKVIVEFNNQTFELFDYNKSSIFTGSLLAPLESGVYFGNIVLTDIAGNTTRFEQVIKVPVKSS